jgi:nucleoid-associated protein YgaU
VPAPTSQSIVVQKGDTLWNLSRQHLGKANRWLELLAANPNLSAPTRLVPGTSLVLPSKTVKNHPAASTVTVQEGDTLSHIALSAYGHAFYWPCIAQANPLLDNPNRLEIGQLLQLPDSCSR